MVEEIKIPKEHNVRKRIVKINAANIARNASLLASMRVEGEGLYELFEPDYGHHPIVRFTGKNGGKKILQWDRALARRIMKAEANAHSADLRQSMNSKLNTGFSETIDGVRCDTKTDRLLKVVERDDENMAAIYEASDKQIYLHIVEDGDECIYPTDIPNFDAISQVLRFWSGGALSLTELFNLASYMIEQGGWAR
jgi:hypothetical protein